MSEMLLKKSPARWNSALFPWMEDGVTSEHFLPVRRNVEEVDKVDCEAATTLHLPTVEKIVLEKLRRHKIALAKPAKRTPHFGLPPWIPHTPQLMDH